MYTLEELDHPRPLTKEQADSIINGNEWDITVDNIINVEQTAGLERHLYELRLPDETWVGSVGLHYNKSGKSTGFSYLIANTDICKTDAGIEFAVKTACEFYGGIEDVDGLAEKVKIAVNNKDFEYNQYKDPHCLIEHNGIFCNMTFGAKEPGIYEFMGLNIYDKDSMQAGIYSSTKTDSWYNDIYNKYFG